MKLLLRHVSTEAVTIVKCRSDFELKIIPHVSTSRVSNEVSCVSILKKADRVITEPHWSEVIWQIRLVEMTFKSILNDFYISGHFEGNPPVTGGFPHKGQ